MSSPSLSAPSNARRRPVSWQDTVVVLVVLGLLVSLVAFTWSRIGASTTRSHPAAPAAQGR